MQGGHSPTATSSETLLLSDSGEVQSKVTIFRIEANNISSCEFNNSIQSQSVFCLWQYFLNRCRVHREAIVANVAGGIEGGLVLLVRIEDFVLVEQNRSS